MKSSTMLSCLLAAAATWATTAAAEEIKMSFDGFKVYRVPVGAKVGHVNSVAKDLGLDFWQPAFREGVFADVEVPPGKVTAFLAAMQGFELFVMHEDLGKSMDVEAAFAVYADGSANDTWFESYHPYSDHVKWLRDLQAQYPNISEVVSSGRSGEGNDITGIHLFGSGGKDTKPAIIFHGTVHAREWIASMVVEYMAYSLLSGYTDNQEIRGFLDKYDFFMLPIVNPDGFKYTQTRNRMWRKNRQADGNSRCVGRDINRNWPYKWDGPGSSTNPCQEDYRGEEPGDGTETKSLIGLLQKVKDRQGLKLYIDFHSYSQLLMTPYGWTCDATPANNDELQSLANGAAEAIRAVHGTEFRTGPICSTIYQTAGNSVDYVADVVKSDYAFATELRDTGASGFILPPDQIVPSGEEAFEGVKYLLRNMK
ncbi:hypothetical protein L249_1762 [Ophiocordyceps polyrhachis-furcata BCC 54312]|uniref:Peptidase M14 domain-containing protein n=1 Tax=Ophiocordyceps polyrhachis-furcata BCC 54312 TaxID=1330021 RepID=A0A367LNC2_9HYPO|nr:hypothetical protein L249_1762 [Ophiocordyceps polyrhachis-furcata BCC 54312]